VRVIRPVPAFQPKGFLNSAARMCTAALFAFGRLAMPKAYSGAGARDFGTKETGGKG
jgi:hypothetical protein